MTAVGSLDNCVKYGVYVRAIYRQWDHVTHRKKTTCRHYTYVDGSNITN